MNLQPYLNVASFLRCFYLVLSFSAAKWYLTGLPPFSVALLFTSWAKCLFVSQDGFSGMNIGFKIELKGKKLSVKFLSCKIFFCFPLG